MSLTVLKGGLMTTIQDLGRPGFQRQGVVVGGAVDALSARLANVLVGNPENTALLEMALIGPNLCFGSETLIAWCGAGFEPHRAGTSLPANRPVLVREGEAISFGAARSGTRAWLAVAGGIEVPVVLGSRSTCVRSGMGGLQGRPLTAGDRLEWGSPSPWATQMTKALRLNRPRSCAWSVRPETFGQAAKNGQIRVLRGPEWDWFSAEAQHRFFAETYTVTKEADRMGVRLSGPALELEVPREMISSGVGRGVVQVPPNARPIVLLCDCQTVGGYPRLAVVSAADEGRLAQLRQGDRVRFEEISLRQAHELLLAREQDFRRVRMDLSHRTG